MSTTNKDKYELLSIDDKRKIKPSVEVMKKHLIQLNKQIKKDLVISNIAKMKKPEIQALFDKYFSMSSIGKYKGHYLPAEEMKDLIDENRAEWDFDKFRDIPKISEKKEKKKVVKETQEEQEETKEEGEQEETKQEDKQVKFLKNKINSKQEPKKPPVLDKSKGKYFTIDPSTLTEGKQKNLYKLIMTHEAFLKNEGVDEYNYIIAGVLSPLKLYKNLKPDNAFAMRNRTWDKKYMDLAKRITSTAHPVNL